VQEQPQPKAQPASTEAVEEARAEGIEQGRAETQAAADEAVADEQAKCADLRAQLRTLKLEIEQERNAKVVQQSAAESKLERETGLLMEQVEELKVDFESLSLDKEMVEEELEQLTAEHEQSQRLVKQLKEERELLQTTAAATPPASSSRGEAPDLDLAQVTDQNAKLREAVTRLHESTTSEISALTQKLKTAEKELKEHNRMSQELETVKLSLAKHVEENAELLSRVETLGGLEAMVESLTERNLDLSEEAARAVEDQKALREEVRILCQ
jgi:hypothetical protein